MWVHWVSTYFVDPENWVGQMYDSQFHGTWKASAWYQNPKVDELLRKARGLVEQAERAPLYEEATRLIVADFPDIWIYNTIELAGHVEPDQGRALLPGRQRLRSALDEPAGRGRRARGADAPLRPPARADRDPVAVRAARRHLSADPGGAGRPGGGARRRQRDAAADRSDPS